MRYVSWGLVEEYLEKGYRVDSQNTGGCWMWKKIY